VLRTAVKWGHLQENPATQVDMPPLADVHLKWALTTEQVTALLEVLPALPRTLVGLAVLTGLRRGELFALRWSDVDERLQCLSIQQAVYEGVFSTPKTAAGRRQVPLSDAAFQLLTDWKTRGKRTEPEALVFSTQSGKPICAKNVAHQGLAPACDKLGLKRVTWLTFRRTYSSWAHAKGVPGKVIAQVMGHTKVDTTLNIYTQVIDGSVRRAAEVVGAELFTIVQNCSRAGGVSDVSH
jgi:integrase